MGPLPATDIHDLESRLDDLDYYQLLEIEPGAPSSRVKRAYYSVSRRFHPDANRHLQGEARDSLERIAKRVSEAYQVLRDARRRQAYDGQLRGDAGAKRIQLVEAQAKAGRRAMEDHQGRTPNGRKFFLRARSDIEKGDLQAALRNLQMALTFEPGNDHFKRKLAELREQTR